MSETLLTNDWIGPWKNILTMSNSQADSIKKLFPTEQGERIERLCFKVLNVTRTSLFQDSFHHDPTRHEPFDVTASSLQYDQYLNRNILVQNEAFADFKTITNLHNDYDKVIQSYNAQVALNDNRSCVLRIHVTPEQLRSCPEFWVIALVPTPGRHRTHDLIIRKHRHFQPMSRYSHNINIPHMGPLGVEFPNGVVTLPYQDNGPKAHLYSFPMSD